jgi:signal transduction histidine kinase
MNSLRAKIALLLVVAIVSLVGILTAFFFYMFPPPRIDRELAGLAGHVTLAAQAAKSGLSDTPLSRSPANGQINERLTERLRAALTKHKPGILAERTVVSRLEGRRGNVISIPIEGKRWLLFKMAGAPPRAPRWLIFFVWLTLITSGVAAIAILTANRMVRPLVLLESAVESIGPDATLPALPESGPAEVRATAKALNSLSARLRSAMESRMRLIAAAGHDLRTPITRMRLRAEFVEDGEDRTLWLRDIDELEHIADSAISLVREEKQWAPPELIRLDELVSDIVTELQEQKYAVTLMDTTPTVVRATRLALSRALRNLLINAATHGLRARVRVERAQDGGARIVITDEGPGIPKELLGQVFDPFFRADRARSQEIPGAGLGLTIAHDIIRRAGGEIEISNRPQGGVQQTVLLPLAAPDADKLT